MIGCSGDIIIGGSKDGYDSVSPSFFSAPAPVLSKALDPISPDKWRAILKVDGGVNIELTIAAESASTAINDLTIGHHNFEITWSFIHSEFNEVVIASANISANLVAGGNAVHFSKNQYAYPDNDKDGFSNLAELEAGTNPNDPNDPPPEIAVPDVVGLSEFDAKAQIETAGLVVGTVTREFDVSVVKDSVISQDPVGGSNKAKGSSVSLVVSDGPKPICPDGMTQYFKMDESAAPYKDFLGGPSATCTNCPIAITGKVGGGQHFNGTDNRVDVADEGKFDWGGAEDISIEYWMKSTSNCSGNEVIVGRQGPSESNPHIWTGCLDDGDKAFFGMLDSDGNNGGTNDGASSQSDITDGKWNHIVAVKDVTQIHVYVNGVKGNSVTKNYTADFKSTTPLNIGYLNFPSRSNLFRYNGDLDEIAYYSRALTETEILEHYNNGAGKDYCHTGQ